MYETDGFSLKPLFRSNTLPERAFFTYAPLYDPQWGATPGAVIRKGPYKFLLDFGDYIDLEKDKTYVTQPKEELYHLPYDISERNNLLKKEPKIAKELKSELLN